MPNGRPGDHPLTDILHHKIETFSPTADDLIRQIAQLVPSYRLDEMIEWRSPPPSTNLKNNFVKCSTNCAKMPKIVAGKLNRKRGRTIKPLTSRGTSRCSRSPADLRRLSWVSLLRCVVRRVRSLRFVPLADVLSGQWRDRRRWDGP